MNRFLLVSLIACMCIGNKAHAMNDPIEKSLVVENSFDALAFQFEFCGQRIPLEIPEVREQLKAELIKRRRAVKESRELLLRVYRYRASFQKILRKAGIPDDFFYVAVAESGLTNAVSPKGAAGFWQFMPETALEYGLEVSETVDERFHPEKATQAATTYLRRAYRTFNDWTLVATSYNLGMGGMRRAIESQQTNNLFDLDLNKESRNYIYRIASLKHLLENPSNYGIYSVDYKSYVPVPYKLVTVAENIESFSQFSEYQGVERAQLRLLNPWLISNKLIAKPGKIYHIRIPLRRSFRAEELLTDSMRKLLVANRRQLADNTLLSN